LHKVHVELFEFHGCDEVFVSGVIVCGVGANVSIFIFGPTAETVRVLGEDFADDEPLVGR